MPRVIYSPRRAFSGTWKVGLVEGPWPRSRRTLLVLIEHVLLPREADMCGAKRECPLSANSGHSVAAHSMTSSARASSDRRHGEAERLGGLEVDDQLVLGRRLHRQVGRLLALEDAIDVAGRAPEQVDQIGPSARVRPPAVTQKREPIDRGQLVPCRQRDDQLAMKLSSERARRYDQTRHSARERKCAD